MAVSAGYVHGYNRRAPTLSVLIVEPHPALLSETLARYVVRFSFAMTVVPERVTSAVKMFAFDGIVVPPAIDPATRADVLARIGEVARVFEIDDPLAIARDLRGAALARRPRMPLRA